ALADGSRLWLNTASAIDLRFDARARQIRLLAGEIFIATAPDAHRPFLVDTAHGRLRALGTRFNVRQEDGETRLAVYHGAVDIRTAAGDATRIVAAGRQARFTKNDITSIESADFAREAWTRGALVADNITLGEVVRELRRYRQDPLDVADAVADLKVYGNFPIRDTDRVLAMLASALPVRIDQSDPARTRIEAVRQP
ncbi:MAG: FecR domain-containing protein, partial [Sulfuritalea sp.]|nr:FecR domain-containing protein [Sulfuritalea sp.]